MPLLKVLRTTGLFVGTAVAVQVLLAVAAIASSQAWLLWPLAPGIEAMRLLPGDPRTAGSFIAFPTLAQTLLALAVNTLAAAAAIVVFRAARRRLQVFNQG